MRIIDLDFYADKGSTIFLGYAGEHLSTVLNFHMPAELGNNDCVYVVNFLKDGESSSNIVSHFAYKSRFDTNIVEYYIPSSIMGSGASSGVFHLVAYGMTTTVNNEVKYSILGKSTEFHYVIDDAITTDTSDLNITLTDSESITMQNLIAAINQLGNIQVALGSLDTLVDTLENFIEATDVYEQKENNSDISINDILTSTLSEADKQKYLNLYRIKELARNLKASINDNVKYMILGENDDLPQEGDEKTDYYKLEDNNYIHYRWIDNDYEIISGSSITVDDALSDSSENPVQNKVIAEEVGDLKSALDDVYDNNGVPAQNLTISDFTSQDCYKTNGESQVFGGDWVSTDFIPCYGSTVKYKGHAFWSSSVDLAVVAFFGVDKQMTHYIASSEVLSAISNGTVSGEVSTQPGDYYVRVISYTSRVPDSYVVVSAGNLYSKLSVVDGLSDAVGTIGELKSAFNEDLIGSIAWIDGHHAFGVGMDAYNLRTYDANYHCTNYFPVADGVFRYNGVPMSLNDLKSFTGSSSNNVVIFSKNGKIVGWYRNGNKEYSDDGDGMSIDFYGSNYTLLTVSPDYAMLSDLYKGTEQNKKVINEIENNIMPAYYGIGANIFNKNDVVFNGEYYGDDGEVHQFQGYGYSKLIPISGGTTYYFSKPFFFNFYDSSKAFISGGHSSSDGNHTTAPQTAAYLRVSLTEANKDSMMVVANGLPSEYVPFAYRLSDGLKQDFSNLKICCIGDSLTQGVNGDTTDYDVTFIKENYPYYMGKTLKNTGILNYGRYGADPITWYNNYKSNFATPDGTYDAALIMLGTNGGISDTLDTDVEPYNSYSDYANTTCGCYCKIIEWLLDVTSNHICIVLVTPPTNWIADRPDKYTVVKNSVEVIKKIAARYSLPVIDVFNDSGISKYQSTIFRPYDGLHFCAKGYHKIGTFIGNQFMSIYSTFGNTDADTVTGGVIFNKATQ